MRQGSLFDTAQPSTCAALRFDGPDVAAPDAQRMTGQLFKVRELMLDGRWRTLAEIAAATGASEAGASARLRDLRKERFGGFTVDRKNLVGGLWTYRVVGP